MTPARPVLVGHRDGDMIVPGSGMVCSLPGVLFSPLGNGSAHHSRGLERLHRATGLLGKAAGRWADPGLERRQKETVAGSQGQVL